MNIVQKWQYVKLETQQCEKYRLVLCFYIRFERNENISQYLQLLQGISSYLIVFQYMRCEIFMKSSETLIPRLQISNFCIRQCVVCGLYFMISYKI